MRLDEIGGEFGFIARIQEAHAATPREGLLLGIGDDAALLEVPANRQSVVTTDMLLEGVHFRRDWSDPYSIGWKAAAANLSDIAAMGADPTFAFVSLAAAEADTVEGLDRLYDGFSDCLNRYGASLAGGDTNRSPDGLVLSITLLGSVPTGQALTRSGARPGDLLLVTGSLGQSAAGLALLTEHGFPKAEKLSHDLVAAHRRPHPRVAVGRAAGQTRLVHAAMDLSDGLAGDLPKLCASSGVGARIDLAALPCSDELHRIAETLGQDPAQIALTGGEDFELLLAVPPSGLDAVRTAVEATGVPVTQIGEITRSGLRIVGADGEAPLPAGGWDHFAP